MENSISDDIMRSNLIYNLSRDDEFSPLHDSEIETDYEDIDYDGDSDSTDTCLLYTSPSPRDRG